MIPKADCKNRRLYRIHSRNLAIGVFNEATGGFLGLRTKFRNTFVFEEYHWENESFATVQPQEELPEELPGHIELKESLGTQCETCKTPAAYINFPEGEREIALKSGGKMTVPGEWRHQGETTCTEVRAVSVYNQALDAWLHEMVSKYGNPPIIVP